MASQAPWSPTAHAFAQHQFSHVANFWKQGRQASFRLEALSSGKAELNLTFQLHHASEVIPPPSAPSHVFPASAPQRPIHPLFPKGFFSQRSGVTVPKPASQKKPSSKQRKSYRRSVLYRASLAAPSLSPPKNGSLRQAALASVQHLQAVSASPVDTQSYRKRSYSESDSPSAQSPSNFPLLAQRIRSDLQIGEESPERELLRTTPLKFSSPSSPRVKGFPPPAPLAFTPPKIQEGCETPAPLVFTPVPPEKYSCSNCEAEMTPDHQCEAVIAASSLSSTPLGSPNRTIGRRIFPKKFVKEMEKDTFQRTVKCHVCACLGRETSMVLCGFKCPSCGITATES